MVGFPLEIMKQEMNKRLVKELNDFIELFIDESSSKKESNNNEINKLKEAKND